MLRKALFLSMIACLAVACGKKKDESGEGAATEGSEATAKSGAVTKEEAMKAIAAAENSEDLGKKACTLYKKEEAEALLGGPVKEPEVEGFTCTWTHKDEDLTFVIVELRPGAQWATAKKMAEQMQNDEHKIEPLSDLGEDAFYSDIVGEMVLVKKGDHYVQLSLMGVEDAKDKLIAETKTVVGRL